MNATTIDIISPWFLAVVIGMSRILPCMLIVPLFNTRQIQGMLRHGIAIALALLIVPHIHQQLIQDNILGLELAFLLFKEAFLGLLLGVLLALPFWLFESVGSLLDNQRGALTGGQLNPGLGTESILGGMLQQAVIILLIVTMGIPVLLDVIWSSYQIWPPTKWLPQPGQDGVLIFLSLIAEMFHKMVLYAAPLVCTLLLIDFAMAMLSLYSPHLQVFILAMPAKSFVGLALLAVYLTLLWEYAGQELEKYLDLKNYLIYLLEIQ